MNLRALRPSEGPATNWAQFTQKSWPDFVGARLRSSGRRGRPGRLGGAPTGRAGELFGHQLDQFGCVRVCVRARGRAGAREPEPGAAPLTRRARGSLGARRTRATGAG